MDIIVSYKSDKPIYEQIYDQIASQIISGELPANYCLPSIRLLSRDIGVSIITIKKAWELLEFNGFIYTKAGVGCFVTEYAENNLENKKFKLAIEKLQKDLPYYKSLNLSLEELIELIKNEY